MKSRPANIAILSVSALVLPYQRGDAAVRYNFALMSALSEQNFNHLILLSDNIVRSPAFPMSIGEIPAGQILLTSLVDTLRKHTSVQNITPVSPFDAAMPFIDQNAGLNDYTLRYLLPLERALLEHGKLDSPSSRLNRLLSERNHELEEMNRDDKSSTELLLYKLQCRINSSLPYGRAARREEEVCQNYPYEMPTFSDLLFHTVEQLNEPHLVEVVYIACSTDSDTTLNIDQKLKSMSEQNPQLKVASISVAQSDEQPIIEEKLCSARSKADTGQRIRPPFFLKFLIPVVCMDAGLGFQPGGHLISSASLPVTLALTTVLVAGLIASLAYNHYAQRTKLCTQPTEGKARIHPKPLPSSLILPCPKAACCLPSAKQWTQEELEDWLTKKNQSPKHEVSPTSVSRLFMGGSRP